MCLDFWGKTFSKHIYHFICCPVCSPTRLGALFFFNLLFIFVFLPILGLLLRHMEVPGLGVKSELQPSAYTTAHSNTGSLTHWARPGIEPATSWLLVGFIKHWAMSETPRLGALEDRNHITVFLVLPNLSQCQVNSKYSVITDHIFSS